MYRYNSLKMMDKELIILSKKDKMKKKKNNINLPKNHSILVDPFLALPGKQRGIIRGAIQENSTGNSMQPHLQRRAPLNLP